MDKNFFKFDIDDEILMSSEKQEVAITQKSQSKDVFNKKNIQNNNFFCFKKNNGVLKQIEGYEKKSGLENQKKINSNICLVDDYVNFDFRAKQKASLELAEINNSNLNIINLSETDKEVGDVLTKAHIGVIFY